MDLKISFNLLPALFEEILGLLEGRGDDQSPGPGRAPVVGGLADFPANISVCLKLLHAGENAFKTFLLDRCHAFRVESEFDRECIIWDLNRATHTLIHREIQDICKHSLHSITEICGRIEGHGNTRRHSMPVGDAMHFQT
ncbi:MAG: hypothetical protein DRP71_09905 [Verrucomicrobia bacterium]|nr:MAG: hypothetical protein DRP71_09905 [Verrucomicrobiota bacterium]